MTCSLQVKKNPVHDYVRILCVTDDTVTWRITKDGVSLKKTSDISDILSLKTCVEEDVLLRLKPGPTRGSTLDVSDT